MATPIYKAFLVRLTDAWYQLSEEERDVLVKKIDEAREQVGGKTVMLCDSGWSSEKWPTFGVEVYPSIEAVQKHAAMLTDLCWYRYIESFSVLGVEPSDYAALIS